MKKILKFFIKTIVVIIILIAVIFCLVLALRTYNDYKYKDEEFTSTIQYYEDVTNLELYPKEVEGVELKYVDEGGLQGFRFIPNNKLYKGVVIAYGGSEGSPNFEEAKRLAKEGYETFALFMFGMKNQQKTLTKVPLEQFEDVINYVNNNIEDNKPLTVIGVSKGAEYALNLASKYQEIDNLILFAPSSYNFAGLDFNDYGSSWTYKKEEIPYIDLRQGSFIKNIVIPSITKAPISYKETYESAIKKDLLNYEKLIPVKDIKANILMFAGEEDAMWNSFEMANIIKKQNPNAKLYSFKGAGHIFGASGIINDGDSRIKVGGTFENNKKAEEETLKIKDDFLQEQHKK